jgi:hypothetical protein
MDGMRRVAIGLKAALHLIDGEAVAEVDAPLVVGQEVQARVLQEPQLATRTRLPGQRIRTTVVSGGQGAGLEGLNATGWNDIGLLYLSRHWPSAAWPRALGAFQFVWQGMAMSVDPPSAEARHQWHLPS